MREKKRCRWLALLLAVVMVLSVLPTAVFAEGEPSADTFYKIVHLDCGRKYFSPENIKKIIDNAAAAGFNQVELYLSDNQGFRFALDDMKVTTSTGNTYDLTPALGDGYSDGSKYPDGSGRYLTQSEMTDIISYAAGKGIDIVPCINVPGHMGAILEEFTQFKYSGSNSSIDLENAEAVAFALAITEKYATYFADRDVKFYNLGADEYANDLSTMGFQGLYTSGKYQKFVDFLNSAAQIVIDHNMTPRAFNDGIYYNEDNTYSINSAIQVCYWSCGWNGYNLASAQYLVNQDLDVINTHGDYYWVLGNSGWQCSADKASEFNYTSFQYRTGTTGNGTISNPAGAMFCIWCDVGNANGTDGGTAVVSATADVIAAFGAALPASESGGETGGEGGNTGVEVTKNETITVTVGQTATATISGANYAGTYTTDDPTVATVEVTGVDGTEATTTYTPASVTCDTLISGDSNSWTAASGYYYTPDGTNYYPVYAKRSSATKGTVWRYKEYTYTWGYKVGDSEPIQIGKTQVEGARLSDGRYATPEITVYTQETAAGTPASTTVTFTGVAVGTTYVTVGNTRYTINVVAEDLSTVTPLTVEFWITNRQVTANGATIMTIQANASNVYSVTGALISSLVPATGTLDSNTAAFWKCTRLASNNKQTTTAGVDKTNSGTDFIYIRYWEGSWAYSADGKNWTNVVNGDQIVAYYMQKTEVTDEVTTEVVDWGVIPSTSYNSTNFVLLDFAVKYESGELVPSSFPVSGKTMAFHCDPDDTKTVHQYNNESKNYWYNNYRDINRIMAVATTDYEVYMITVAPTNDSNTTQVAGNANAAISYTYGGTEKVIWVDDESNLGDFADESLHYTSISGKYSYSFGGEAALPGLEIFNRHGMLVTYYVRAKVTEDSLSVHYIDQTVNHEFYSYNIAVKSGTVFNENIALADPWKGNLANGSVTNLQDKTQTVSADLSTMPAIGAQYRYSDYTCKEVVRSADGKNVYLYYTFNNAKKFVIDFGLPLKITTRDLSISGDWTSATVTGAKYGTATATIGDGVIYTPTKVLTGVETLQLTLTGTNGSVSHQIYIYPASNVLYEDGFITIGDGWSGDGSKVNTDGKTQTTGTSSSDANVYGYDPAYSSTTGFSGSQYTATVDSDSRFTGNLAFTFTGTGFDLIGQCGAETGTLGVRVADSTGVKKVYTIDTSFNDTNVADNLYQVPLLHCDGLAEGEYTVTVFGAYMNWDSNTVLPEKLTLGIDGFRVYGKTDNDAYVADEQGVKYVNVLDAVEDNFAGYIEGNAEGTGYTKGNYESSGGPQNEIYLSAGNAATFQTNLKNGTVVQVSARAVTGNAYLNDSTDGITSNTEMYYAVTVGEKGVITIANGKNATGMLAIANLKVPVNTTFAVPTEETYVAAYAMLRSYSAAVVEPEEPDVPEEPEYFKPEKFEARVDSVKLYNRKIVTLTVTTSTDVDHVTVNGKTYQPINKRPVKRGLSSEYVFSVVERVKKNETVSFEVIAYDAGNFASEAKSLQG